MKRAPILAADGPMEQHLYAPVARGVLEMLAATRRPARLDDGHSPALNKLVDEINRTTGRSEQREYAPKSRADVCYVVAERAGTRTQLTWMPTTSPIDGRRRT
jgi:UDP-glucose 4-epimerase